jgi:type I restriction enzyme R subunit
LTAQANIFAFLNAQQKEFIDFVLSKYIELGVEKLDQEKMATLLNIKISFLGRCQGSARCCI